MTIASEISRLQCAKADICTAIENKGVTVGNITIDDYACCIDEIPTGSQIGTVDVLLVGGGGAGGNGQGWDAGGGGGSGDVIETQTMLVVGCSYCVEIGEGGTNTNSYCISCNGCRTTFNGISAIGGGFGGGVVCNDVNGVIGGNGASGGGGRGYTTSYCYKGGIAIGVNGCKGGNGTTTARSSNYSGGGGGGPGGCGANASCLQGGTGGAGYTSTISGKSEVFGGGGGGGSAYSCIGSGGGTGGDGGCCCQRGGDAKGCGGGGGGGGSACGRVCCFYGGKGGNGLVILRYKTDGSCGIKNAIGGDKYTCGDYTIHCFKSSGNLCVFPNDAKKTFEYLVVGGGGGGGIYSCSSAGGGGGGGGDVKIGETYSSNTEFCIIVGARGTGAYGCMCGSLTRATDGCPSCIIDNGVAIDIAKGGCRGTTICGGDSGSGCKGGVCGGSASPQPGAGGAGASENGCCSGFQHGSNTYCYLMGGNGGRGKCGYGGGGGGGGRGYSGLGCDGGGNGALNCSQGSWNGCPGTNCGGGGGGAWNYNYNAGYAGNGACGVVDICYKPGEFNINSATGGDCCYECNGYCVHRFTSNGTFCITG